MKSILKTLIGCIFILLVFAIMEAIAMQVLKSDTHENHVHTCEMCHKVLALSDKN